MNMSSTKKNKIISFDIKSEVQTEEKHLETKPPVPPPLPEFLARVQAEKVEIKRLEYNSPAIRPSKIVARDHLPVIVQPNTNNAPSKHTNESLDTALDQLPSIVKWSHQKKNENSPTVNVHHAIKYVDYFPLKSLMVNF
jgi:hypothetical protein